MKNVTLFLVVLTTLYCNAQDSIFSKVYHGNDAYEVRSLAVDPHYRFAHVGQTDEAIGTFTYLDSIGNVLSSQGYYISGDLGHSDFLRVVNTSDSNFLVLGAIQYMGAPIDMGLVMKVNPAGDVLWSNIVYEGNSIAYRAKDAVELSNGDWMAIVQNESHGKCSLVHMDADGTFISSNEFSLPNNDEMKIRSIRALSDSTYVLAGWGTVQSQQTAIAFVVNDTGSVLWTYSFTGGQFYECEVNESSIWLATNFSTSIGITSLTHSGNLTSADSYMGYDGNENFGLTALHDSTLALVQGNDYNGYLLVTTVGQTDAQLYAVYVNTTDVTVSRKHGIAIVGTGPLYGLKSFYEPQTGFIHLDSLANGEFCSDSGMQPAITPISPVNTGIVINTNIGYSADPIVLTSFTIDPVVTEGCVDRYGSVDEQEEDFIVLYPNPANTEVRIQFKQTAQGILELYTTDGRLIQQKKVSTADNTIQLMGLSEGCYVYRFTKENSGSKSVSGILIVE